MIVFADLHIVFSYALIIAQSINKLEVVRTKVCVVCDRYSLGLGEAFVLEKQSLELMLPNRVNGGLNQILIEGTVPFLEENKYFSAELGIIPFEPVFFDYRHPLILDLTEEGINIILLESHHVFECELFI